MKWAVELCIISARHLLVFLFLSCGSVASYTSRYALICLPLKVLCDHVSFIVSIHCKQFIVTKIFIISSRFRRCQMKGLHGWVISQLCKPSFDCLIKHVKNKFIENWIGIKLKKSFIRQSAVLVLWWKQAMIVLLFPVLNSNSACSFLQRLLSLYSTWKMARAKCIYWMRPNVYTHMLWITLPPVCLCVSASHQAPCRLAD